MNDRWSSYGNSYLRHLDFCRAEGTSMTISTQSVQELLLALEATQIFVKRLNTTKAGRIYPIRIEFSGVDSKGMST